MSGATVLIVKRGLVCYALGTSCTCQGFWCLTMALRIVKSLRIQAVSATFATLPAGPQALVKPFEDGVILDRDQRTHVQGRPDMGTTSPGRAGPPQGATVPIEGRDADEGRDALTA